MDRVLQTLAAMEGLLVVQRAAELLVHQPQTLYKAIKSGRLPHVRTLGGSVRVDPDVLASWLRGRRARWQLSGTKFRAREQAVGPSFPA